ncbi:MAG: hypothetical protein AAF195_04365 [Pseudomonadota bacterium]
MRKKLLISAVSTSLAVSGFISSINTILENSENFVFQQPGSRISITSTSTTPIVIQGLPSLDEHDTDSYEISMFKVGLMHYNYQIITAIIIAPDHINAASKVAIFKRTLDQIALSEYPQNGEWKSHLNKEPVSFLDIAKIRSNNEAGVLYTIC